MSGLNNSLGFSASQLSSESNYSTFQNEYREKEIKEKKDEKQNSLFSWEGVSSNISILIQDGLPEEKKSDERKISNVASNSLATSKMQLASTTTIPSSTKSPQSKLYLEIKELIRDAEQASLKENFNLLHDIDLNLASHFLVLKDKKKVFTSEFLESTTLFRLLRLDLPETKAVLIAHFNSKAKKLQIINDKGSLFSDTLEGRLTDQLFEKIRQRIFMSMESVEKSEIETATLALIKAFNKNITTGEEELQKVKPIEQFVFLVHLLTMPIQNSELVLSKIFPSLMNAAVESQLPAEQIADLVQLARLDPKLRVLLGQGQDEFQLMVKDLNSNVSILPASRLLLSYGSDYFKTLVTNKSIKENNDSIIFDLTKTSFDKDLIQIFLYWLVNPQMVSFASDTKKEDDLIKHLERFLLYFPAFSLTNEAEFLEKIQLHFAEAITEKTLAGILKIALSYKLQLTTSSCIEFINDHFSDYFKIQIMPDGNLKIEQGASNEDIPAFLLKVVEALGSKIKSAVLITTKEDGLRRCRFSVCEKIGRFTKKYTDPFLKIGRRLRPTALRAALCYGAIVAIQKFANITPWGSEKIIPVSLGVGVGYPLIAFLFQRCVIERCIENRAIIFTIPNIFPVSIQRPIFACSQRINDIYIKTCQKSLIETHKLILSLPKELSVLDLSLAKDLTDETLKELVHKYKDIVQLDLTTHPLLTANGYESLALLKDLKHLRLLIKDGEAPGSLNELNLALLFGNRESFKIEIVISDYTISYYELPFLEKLPAQAEIHVVIEHVPIPNAMVLFESYQDMGGFAAWPEAISRLVASCSKITHLEIGQLSISNKDLIAIANHYPKLQSLKIQLCQSLTHEGFDILSEKCTDLKKLELEVIVVAIDADSISQLVTRCSQLEHVVFDHILSISDEVLQNLSKAKNLKFCKLISLPLITDEGIQSLLDRIPFLEGFDVQSCEGVSNDMLLKLFQRPSSFRKAEIQLLKDKIHSLITPNTALYLEKKTVPPILFQFLIDNLLYGGFSSAERFNKVIRRHLELPTKKNLFFRASQLRALSYLPFFSLEKQRKSIMDKELQLSKKRDYFLEYCFTELSPKNSPKIAAAYMEFLLTVYSKDFVREINSLIENCKIEIDKFMLAKKEISKLLLPLLHEELNQERVADLFNRIVSDSTYRVFFGTLLNFIVEKAQKNHWTDDQKCAAFLAMIFFNWSENNVFFIKNREESPTVNISSIRIEEKEEFKESKS